MGRVALALVAMAATACGTDLVGPASSSTSLAAAAPGTTSTTAPLTGEVAVAFPVVGCTPAFGSQVPGQGWKPSILLAPIPTVLVGQVEFYTDGTRSILGPSGWACTETDAADGGVDLAVVPPGTPDPPTSGSPTAGAEGVFATFDTTAHSAGVDLVCPFFTLPTFQQRDANCNGQKPPGEILLHAHARRGFGVGPGRRGRDTGGIGRGPHRHRRGDLPSGDPGSRRRREHRHRGGIVRPHQCRAVSDDPLRLRSP